MEHMYISFHSIMYDYCITTLLCLSFQAPPDQRIFLLLKNFVVTGKFIISQVNFTYHPLVSMFVYGFRSSSSSLALPPFPPVMIKSFPISLR